MALPVEYMARETASNLWRNRLMTIAAVLTVAVSLSLVGAALLLRQGVSNATSEWQHGINVILWFQADATHGEEHAVETQVKQLTYVRTCTFRTQAFDFNEAHHVLPPSESQALSRSTTPASYRCALDNPALAASVSSQFRGQPGVLQVGYPAQTIHTMESVTHALQWAFLAVALILLASASVLIVNTIRLAIFARRREVAVMKLVGATNWFIRIPFMFEGLVQGVLGAAVAVLAVLGLRWLLDVLAGSGSGILTQMHTSVEQVTITAVCVVLVGLAVGIVGPVLAIRRFLDA